MNRDQIIQWANAVGFAIHAEEPYVGITPVTDRLERFASLVRSAALEEAAAVCDRLGVSEYPTDCDDCASAIRALKDAKEDGQ